MWSLAFERDAVGLGMDELELKGALKAFGKGVGGLEAGGEDLVGTKLGGGAEFLDAHRGDGQLPAGHGRMKSIFRPLQPQISESSHIPSSVC